MNWGGGGGTRQFAQPKNNGPLDAEWLRDYGAQFSESAFAQLHARHNAKVRSTIRSRFYLTDDQADDVMQATWLTVARNIHIFFLLPHFRSALIYVASEIAGRIVAERQERTFALMAAITSAVASLESTSLQDGGSNQ